MFDPMMNKTVTQKLFTYTGQATAGGWDDTALKLELSSVFDAVDASVPTANSSKTCRKQLANHLQCPTYLI